MKHSIGIDFGTTKTMVSFFNSTTGQPQLVVLDPTRDRASIPTTIHIDESGECLFGEDADEQIQYDPEGYCRAFKLHLGEADPVLSRVCETAESLTGRFLHHVKEECEQTVFHGETIDTATITIPVKFSPARKESLKRAAEAAGFTSVSFIPEPVAAGTAFLRDNPTDKFARALVLDWGGGTLDIAVISRDENGRIRADRHCAEGRDDVGGEEMDLRLLHNVDTLWTDKYGLKLLGAEENEPRLLREAEKTKKDLSKKDPGVYRQGLKKLEVSRDQFRKLIGEMLDNAVQLVQSTLAKDEKQGNPEPDAILLIGGTCLCPAVREAMEKNFPKLRVLSWHRLHEAVALGATTIDKSFSDTKLSTQNPAGTAQTAESKNSNDKVPLEIQKLFTKKYNELKNGRYPEVGEPREIHRLPDGGWLMKCDNIAAITLRPGDAKPHEIHGAICERWYSEGGAYTDQKKCWLGYPVSDVFKEISGLLVCTFEGGRISWDCHRGILVEKGETHRQDPRSGNSLTFKEPQESKPRPSESSSGLTFKMSREVIASIFRRKYEELRAGPYPQIGEPKGPPYQLPDGGWQMDCGNKVAITLRPGSTTPYAVTGDICERWYGEGGVMGHLGHPIEDEMDVQAAVRGNKIAYFEKGSIFWNAASRTTAVGDLKPIKAPSSVGQQTNAAASPSESASINLKGIGDWAGRQVKNIDWGKTAYVAWKVFSRRLFGG